MELMFELIATLAVTPRVHGWVYCVLVVILEFYTELLIQRRINIYDLLYIYYR